MPTATRAKKGWDMEVRDYLRDEILEEVEAGILSEQEGARRVALIDGTGVMGAEAFLAQLMTAINPPATSDATVPENDPDIEIEHRKVNRGTYELECYVARPKGVSSAPGVIVIHENRGLTDHIRDVARRLAKEGYVALAPDLLSPAGGANSFSDPAEQIAAIGARDREEMVRDLVAAVDELVSLPGVDAEKIGAIGFCFGGGMTWRLVSTDPRIHAAVAFYGPNPPLEDVPKINGPVLGIYGENDERINAGISDIERAMAENGKVFEKEIYEGAGHAFHNDTNPERYHDAAAHAAWRRALEWFDRYLKHR